MNVLIVDDEKLIVENIAHMILKNNSEMQVFKANSVKAAGEIIGREKIDIIFSDIRMPGGDGFELLSRIESIDTEPEFIIISGYSDFEYAKKAISAHVTDYLLKPINEKEFENTLSKAVENVIRKSIGRDSGRIALEDRVKHLDAENILNAMFSGGTSQGEHERLIELLGAEKSRYFMLISIHFSKENHLSDERKSEILDELKEMFLKTAEEEHISLFFANSFRSGENNCLCFGEEEPERFCRSLKRMLQEYKSYFLDSLYVSLSDVRTELRRELYTHAKDAYYDRFLTNDRILTYRKRGGINNTADIENRLKIFESYIASADYINIRKALDTLFSAEYLAKSDLSIRSVYFFTVNSVMRSLNAMDIKLSNEFSEKMMSEEAMENADSTDTVTETLSSMIENVLIEKYPASTNSADAVQRIIQYARANLDKDLTVKEMGRRFSFTPNYLSQIFKKETGSNFVSFINDLRVEKAKELLRGSELKVSEIVEMVGYNDSQYFYRIFKKHTGMTPIEYRMK